MERFSTLVDGLYFTSSNLTKAALIKEYLINTKDPDRGWAIAAIAGTLSFDFFRRKTIKELITKRVDPVLFNYSYDYVGEMSETVAHLWKRLPDDPVELMTTLPSLGRVVDTFKTLSKKEIPVYLSNLLNNMNANQRWALIKLGTRGLRVGVSARFIKNVLAQYGYECAVARGVNKDHAKNEYSTEEIERLWHGLTPPYESLFAWLEGKAGKPDVSQSITYQPVMLSHALDHNDIDKLNIADWQVEWKFDGIRVQLVINQRGKAIFTRTGDNISHSFPDVLDKLDSERLSGVFDGELIALQNSTNENAHPQKALCISSFNNLQQRLNKKKPSKKLILEYPVGIILYDALQIDQKDLRSMPLSKRMTCLKTWYEKHELQDMALSERHNISSKHVLFKLREQTSGRDGGFLEGLMLKRKDSLYVAGRPKGQWYKWKRDPLTIDAVMMYAQRGHGKRSSFYSDYTFGCWQDENLLPVGKAYSGFTDKELKQIDRWVRNNTIGRFGPVKEVKKELVFELAFDSVHPSSRHKSGVALRFPRVHRIRWDKPANEADTLDCLKSFIYS